ncbi:MAG: protease modulator HflC, partial [Polyangiaceae bacterium]
MQGRGLIAGVVLVALVVAYSAALFVDETEHIIITQFGEYKRTLSEPGLAFKIPFAQTAIRIEKRILASDAPAEEYLTADKKRLVADPVTRWRVVEPLSFYTSVGDENRARKRLDDIVLSELRQELANRTMGDMVGSARGAMMARVTERTAAKAKEFGIQVVDVRIKHLDLPKEVQQSVFARMVAER